MKLMLLILLTITAIEASGSNRNLLHSIFEHLQNKYQIYNVNDLNRLKSKIGENNTSLNSRRNPSDLVGNWQMARTTQKFFVTVDSTQNVPSMNSLMALEVSNGGLTLSNDSLTTVLSYMTMGDTSEFDSTMIGSMLFMNVDLYTLFDIVFGGTSAIEHPMLMTVSLDSGYVTASEITSFLDTSGIYYEVPLDTNHISADMENFTFTFDNFTMTNSDSTSTLNVNGSLSPQAYQLEAGVEFEIPTMFSTDSVEEEMLISFYEDGSGLSLEINEEYFDSVYVDSSSISWVALNDSLFITFYDNWYSDSSETDSFAYSFYNDTLLLEQSMDLCYDNYNYYYYFDSYDECFSNSDFGMTLYGISGISAFRNDYKLHFVQTGQVSTISESLTPSRHKLYPAFPNPFNPVTTIGYSIPQNEHINLGIYDIAGRKIKTLVNGYQSSGYNEVKWNATNDLGESVSAGVYLYKIQAGQIIETNKIILLK